MKDINDYTFLSAGKERSWSPSVGKTEHDFASFIKSNGVNIRIVKHTSKTCYDFGINGNSYHCTERGNKFEMSYWVNPNDKTYDFIASLFEHGFNIHLSKEMGQ